MKTIWKSLVQPKMDYCCQLWSPSAQESINKLEDVQRHFFSKIKGIGNLTYWEKLKDLEMYSQESQTKKASDMDKTQSALENRILDLETKLEQT